tara:strand:+ start:2628 stop:2828 length:201 start_codon:yes stop_codon:yes gene_type:complete
MKYQNKHESSRVKRANDINVEATERPSKASNTKTRVLGNREPQSTANGTRISPEPQDETFRHTKRN